MKDCLVEELSNGLVKISEKKGRFKVTVLKSRVSRYIEDYKAGEAPASTEGKVEDEELTALKEEAVKLGLKPHHLVKKETLVLQIEAKKKELEDDEKEDDVDEGESK